METVLWGIVSLLTAACGALIMRELSRNDKVGAKQGMQGENLASIAQSISSMRESIGRLEKADAACDGKVEAVRQELHDRVERQSTKIQRIEDASASQSAHVTAAISELKATMGAMKESVDRLLAADQARVIAQRPVQHAQGDLIGQLQQLVALAPLLRQLSHAGQPQ